MYRWRLYRDWDCDGWNNRQMQTVVDSDCDGNCDCGTWKLWWGSRDCDGQMATMMDGFMMEPVRMDGTL